MSGRVQHHGQFPHLLPSSPHFSSRRSLPLAGGLAGPRQAKSGLGVSTPLRVLPDAHDCELPGAELHRRPRRSAVWVSARFPPEQPDHGAQSWLFQLWNSGKNELETSLNLF